MAPVHGVDGIEHVSRVIAIDHLDVIKTADHIIDLGPEGGRGGGQALVAGPPPAGRRLQGLSHWELPEVPPDLSSGGLGPPDPT